nr:hypothetical protein LTR18_001927 [Exophiala xenobiotica]
MEDTSRTISASPASPASDRVFTFPTCINKRTLPYYSIDHVPGRHDLALRVTDARPTRLQDPHSYHVRIIDTSTTVKDDLTSWRPPLRKKPRLTTAATSDVSPQKPSLPYSGMLRPVGVQKTSSVPSFSLRAHDVADPNNHRPSTSGASQPTTPLQRTNSNLVQRSSSQKKPPASHSSYPVETTCGPPPSYSTQRTRSQDKIRVTDRNPSPQRTSTATRESTISQKSNELRQEPGYIVTHALPVKQDSAAPSSTESSADEANTQEASSPDTPITPNLFNSISAPTESAAMAAEPARFRERDTSDQWLKPTATDEESKGSSSDERKSEDLFLNIAKTGASRGGQMPSQIDKRRSRISLPFFSSARPATGYKSSPIQDRFDTASVSGRSEALNYYNKRASLGQHVPGALSRAYTQDTLRPEALSAREEIGSIQNGDLPRRSMSRRFSNTNTNMTGEPSRHLPRPSTARNSRLASESGFVDRPRMHDHNATESTISTTAPSTVWDELDDLKSRIKKLELTGKLPPSSAAAMTSSDRPKTATTAATTLSSSPKPKAAVTQLQSAIEGIPSTIHPTLHEALGNAKSVISNELYQKLQATAQDALQLSMMMTPEGYTGTGSTIGVSSVSERQVRRRTESMCRSLTELVIALLADNKQAPTSVTRPASRDAYAPSSIGLRSRRYSNELNDRPPVASRVQSRLETRRTSIPFGGTFNQQGSTPEHVYQTPPTALPQMQTTSSSRLGRTTASLRSRRTPGQLDGTTDDDEGSPSVRPVSRAMTEVGTYRQMAKDRAAYSREYTAQHPMPQYARPSPHEPSNATRSTMPANVSTNLISRRKYASPTSNVSTPEANRMTPKEPWGRISIIPAAMSSPIEVTPESQGGLRPSNSRRSLGFASRISSVSSRLRAAKAERNGSGKDTPDTPPLRDMAPSGQELDNMALERQSSGQSVGS